MEKIEYTSGGINCDSCEWNDMSVTNEDMVNWIDKPCPECGANLLTQEDYDAYERIRGILDMANQFSAEQLEQISNIVFDSNPELKAMVENIDPNTLFNMEIGVKNGEPEITIKPSF